MQLIFLFIGIACIIGYLVIRELYLRGRMHTLPALFFVFVLTFGVAIFLVFSVALPTNAPYLELTGSLAVGAFSAFGTYMTKALTDRKGRRHDK